MNTVLTALQHYATPERAELHKRYFKTKLGEYGEGDVFMGVTVPECRTIVKAFSHISLSEIAKHLTSKNHEERLVALLILVTQFSKGDDSKKKEIFDFYIKYKAFANNWDLIDSSADKIIGTYLLDKDISLLKKLALSRSVWDRRIAIVATFAFIKKKRYSETFRISEMLLNDTHDLIHKASGWMLREVGKRCGERVLEDFLNIYYKQMPRTMLRYAIERFPEGTRKAYLHGTI